MVNVASSNSPLLILACGTKLLALEVMPYEDSSEL